MAVAERLLDLRPDTDTRPDRALVNEAQHGREDAATTLIQRYYPRIYSFVSHLTYGRTNAEDLTQEVFARALKGLGRFNGQYQFEHWLFRIAKNLCNGGAGLPGQLLENRQTMKIYANVRS